MLGEKIKELRLSKGLNQIELASKLGVTKQSISNFENENIRPSVDMIIKMANFFDVSTDFLLEINNKKNKTINIDGLTKHQVAIISSLIEEFKNVNNN